MALTNPWWNWQWMSPYTDAMPVSLNFLMMKRNV